MKIEFPKKYSVVNRGSTLLVFVPQEYDSKLKELLDIQPWAYVFRSYQGPGAFEVQLNMAYEITPEQAVEALSRLCEHIMSPPIAMNDELANARHELLTEPQEG